MKKIFTIALAVAALAACNKSEVIETPQGSAISFENVFVDNATKAADLTADNIQNFGVYGTVSKGGQTGLIFENEEVFKSGTRFTYSPAQYWVPAAAYTFSAIAPYADAQWEYDPETAKIEFDNEAAAANQDLLFAYAERETGASISAAPTPVGFTFNHQLSRVRFSFTNGFGEGSNIRLVVKDITITNAHKKGTLAVTVDANGNATTAWEALADNTVADNVFSKMFNYEAPLTLDADTIEGGVVSASTEHFYLIPSNAAYNVTFKIDIYQAGVLLDTYNRTATLQHDMQIGYSYDLKATLTTNNTTEEGDIYPIEFAVSGINGWTEYSDVATTVNQ